MKQNMTPEQWKKWPRLYVPDNDLEAGGQVLLSSGQGHYLRHVMRCKAGEPIRVFNGRDGEWCATIGHIDKKNSVLGIEQQLRPQKSGLDIWVVFSPVKKEPLDMIIQKGTELGAARFVPVLCQHTAVRRMKIERMQTIAIEAAEQCERLDVPDIMPMQDLQNVLKTWDNNRQFIACIERSDAPFLNTKVAEMRGKPSALLVGPEGGFSDQEKVLLERFNAAIAVRLSENILRAETAVITALACLQSE